MRFRSFFLLSLAITSVTVSAFAAPASRRVQCEVTRATAGDFGSISFIALEPGAIGYVRMDGYDTFNREDRFFVKGPLHADPTYNPRTMKQFDRYKIPSEWNIIQLIVPKSLTLLRMPEFPAYVRIEADGGVRDNVSLNCRFVR